MYDTYVPFLKLAIKLTKNLQICKIYLAPPFIIFITNYHILWKNIRKFQDIITMIAGSEMVVISYGIFQNIKKSKKKNNDI